MKTGTPLLASLLLLLTFEAYAQRVEPVPQVGHASDITAAAFALDGKVVVSSSRDNVVKLWNAENGTLLQTITGALVAVGRSGNALLTVEPGGLVLRDLRSGRSLPLKTGPIPTEEYSREYSAQAVAFSPDGERLFRVGPDPGPARQKKVVGIQVWNLSGAGQRFMPLSGDYDYAKAIFSSDGALLIAHNSDEYLPGGGVRKKPGMVRVLKAETGAELYTLAMPAGEKVADVSLSPDNRFLVTQSERELKGSGFSTTVIFYDAGTGRELHRFRRDGPASGLTFSPGSAVFASSVKKDKGAGKSDVTITLWDSMTGRNVRELQVGETRTGVESISFSPDGKTVTASYSTDDELEKDSLIQLWDVASGKRLRSLHSRGSEAGHLTYSSDGRLLASWGAFYSPQSMEVWDVARGKGPLEIAGQRSEIQSVDISRDGKLLALGEQWQVRLWSLTTGAPAGSPLPGIFETFSSDGSMFVVVQAAEAEDRGLTRVLESSSGKELRSFEGRFLSLSRDGRRIFTSGPQGASVVVWDVSTGRKLRTLAEIAGNDEPGAVAVSPDGQNLAVVRGLKIELIDVETGRVLKAINWFTGRAPKEAEPQEFSLKFSPDGKLLAVVHGEMWNQHALKVWRVPAGSLLFSANTGFGAGIEANFSPDGRTIATTGNQIETWDAGTGRRLHLMDVSRYVFETAEYGTSAYFSPDGKILAGIVGGGRSVALLWDTATGRPLPLLRDPLDEASAVGFSPDMRHAVSVGRDGTVKFWRLSDGRLMATLLLLGRDGWLAVRPDGFVDGSADAKGRLRWRRSPDLMDVAAGEAYYEQYHAQRLLADVFAAGK